MRFVRMAEHCSKEGPLTKIIHGLQVYFPRACHEGADLRTRAEEALRRPRSRPARSIRADTRLQVGRASRTLHPLLVGSEGDACALSSARHT